MSHRGGVRYRYTRWLGFNGTANVADWDGKAFPPQEELYDHAGDDDKSFDAFENENLAAQAAHDDTRRQLLAMLRARFDA